MILRSLDGAVRELMIAELELDIAGGTLYLSARLTEAGAARWPGLLRETFSGGTPQTLATAIGAEALLRVTETRHRSGRAFTSTVPASAPETLADGEFNRFHIRGVCARALQLGRKVEVYRAKAVPSPRPESEALIGTVVDPAELLADLRANTGGGSRLGIPPGPNSGLSVFIA